MWLKWWLKGLSSTRTMELAGMALALSQTKSTVSTIRLQLPPPLRKSMDRRSFSRWTVVVIAFRKLRIQALWLLFYQESLYLHSCSCSSFRFQVKRIGSIFYFEIEKQLRNTIKKLYLKSTPTIFLNFLVYALKLSNLKSLWQYTLWNEMESCERIFIKNPERWSLNQCLREEVYITYYIPT